MHYACISFDVWNTLIVSNPKFKEAQVALFADIFEVEDYLQVAQILQELDKEIDASIEISGLHIDFTTRINMLTKQLHKKVPNPNFIEEIYKAQIQLFEKFLPTPSEDALYQLMRILQKKGIKLAIVSNTGFIKGADLLVALETIGLGNIWDCALFSDELNYSKPHPMIFNTLSKQMNLTAASILHIGDNLRTDMEGARKFGFSSKLYTKNLSKFDQNLDTIHSLWDLAQGINNDENTPISTL